MIEDSINPKPKIQNPKSRWPDIALIAILTLLPLLFFWRLITPYPADQMRIAAGDFAEQYFPLRAFAAQAWVSGQIPLWNPYLYGGQPALADIQSGALYPPHVIQSLVLGWGAPLFGQEVGFPLSALEWQVIIHFSLAAVGAYLFARHLFQRRDIPLRRARFGGVIASLVFTYSGYLTGFPVQQLTILQAGAWLPWILWGLDTTLWHADELPGNITPSNLRLSASRITHHSSLKPIAWTSLAFALAILAGHPQTVLYIFYLTIAYTVFHAVTNWQRVSANKEPTRNNFSFIIHPLQGKASSFIIPPLTLWLIIILLSASLAAAQLLPTLEFISHSVRADLSYQAVSAGLPLNELISILYPGFFGGSPEYVGIVTLVLIALALTLAWSRYRETRRQEEKETKDQEKISSAPLPPRSPAPPLPFWTAAGLISLLLAFGGNLFVYPLFYLLAPGFDAVRQQERAFLIFSFSAAILAGYGAIVLTGPLSKTVRSTYILFERRLRVIGIIAVGLTGFFIYGSAAATVRGDEVNLFFGVLRHHLFGLIIFGGMLLLLALRPRRRLRRPWGMALIALWLAFNLFTVNWRFNLEKPTDPPPFTLNGATQFLQTNLKLLITNYQLPITSARIVSGGMLPGGNSAASVYSLQDLTGNTPLQLATVNTFMQQMPAWRLWQLMSVRYVVDQRDISDPGLQLVFEEDELKVFEMGDPFDRVWFVSETEAIFNNEQAIARLAADDFDLRRTAIVAAPLNVSLEDSDATAAIVDFNPTRLDVEVDASGRQLMVVSQIYYPGWQAKIDGQPAELLQVNAALQGVVVPAGNHLVQLTFWPNTFVWGLIISGVALLICGGILVAREV